MRWLNANCELMALKNYYFVACMTTGKAGRYWSPRLLLTQTVLMVFIGAVATVTSSENI